MSTISNASGTPVQLQISSARALVSVLQSIRSRAGTKQQICSLLAGSDGLTFRWEEDAKGMQAAVFLRPEVFTKFFCEDPRRVVGLSLSVLMDTLAVFCSSAGELEIRYPGKDMELLLEARERLGGGAEISSYARIRTQEPPAMRELGDYWEEPSSYFLGPGQLFKEVVEDLEWSGGSVRLRMQRQPPELAFRSAAGGGATGNGTLRVGLPVAALPGFHCAGAEADHVYPLKRLQAAFANLPAARDPAGVSTKVTIDSRGLMKVAHMVSMQAASAGGGGAAAPPASQGSAGPVGVVQFLLLPSEDE